METIKIAVEVNVNLSEATQNFIKSLFGSARCEDCKSETPAVSPATKQVPTKPAAPAPTTKPASNAPSASAAPAATPSPAPESASTKSIEDVRLLLSKKVNEHRAAIKAKLEELGAPSVTKLDPSKYDEMYNYLESL